jgi:hypothetical protein
VIEATVLGSGVAALDATVVGIALPACFPPYSSSGSGSRHGGTADLHRARRGAQSSGGRGFRGKQ